MNENNAAEQTVPDEVGRLLDEIRAARDALDGVLYGNCDITAILRRSQELNDLTALLNRATGSDGLSRLPGPLFRRPEGTSNH